MPQFHSVLPSLLALALLLGTRRPVVSFAVAVLFGGFLSTSLDPRVLLPFLAQVALVTPLSDPGHWALLGATAGMLALVTVLGRAGAFDAFADLATARLATPRRARLAVVLAALPGAWQPGVGALAAAALLRPVTDRLRVSREKLAWLANAGSTSAAALALTGLWSYVLLDVFSGVLGRIDAATLGDHALSAPDLLAGALTWRGYALLMLTLAVLGALTGRDFGPMFGAELRTQMTGRAVGVTALPLATPDDHARGRSGGGWLVVVCFAVAFVGVPLGLVAATRSTSREHAIDLAMEAMAASVLAASALVVVLSVAARRLALREAIAGWIAGAREVLVPALVLLLAWALAGVSASLGTPDWLAGAMRDNVVDPGVLPLLAFVAAAGVAFASGTVMASVLVLAPLALPLAATLSGTTLVVGVSAALLDGALLGLHCSAVSESALLASIGARCDLTDHVRTQVPYALVCAAIAAPVFYGLGWWLGVSLWVVYPLALVALLVVLFAAGRDAHEALRRGPV